MTVADRMLRLLENSDEDPGDLVREVMRWMKASSTSAKAFADRVLGASKHLGDNAADELSPLVDVLNHFQMMFSDSAKAAKDTLLATMRFESVDELVSAADNFEDLVEAKKSPIVSLSRWLIGARPAIGSYVKKIGAIKGSTDIGKPAQEALLHVTSALTQMNEALETLSEHVPTLVKAFGK